MRTLLRRLGASPGFTIIAVASLALGIGANTAIFSFVNAVLLRTLPVHQPERLVDVFTSDSDMEVQATSSYPDYRDMLGLTDAFSDALAYELFISPLETGAGAPEMVMGELVTANYFDLLGIRPALGRALRPGEDDVPGGSPVVVLGYTYWQRALGGDPAVVGRTLRLSGSPYTIIGVAPAGFSGMMRAIEPDVFAPMAMGAVLRGDDDRLGNRGSRSLFVKARLLDGIPPARADAAVRALGERLAAAHPETNENRVLSAIPTNDVAILPFVDRYLTPVAALLLGMVALVLVIACANLAGFLLARGADRRREIAIRLALGAKRAQLVRMLLAESLLLALLGGIAAVGVAWIAVRILTGFQPPLPVPIRLQVPIDTHVLLYTLAISVFAGLAFGLAPGLQVTRPDLAPTLRDESGASTGGRRRVTLRHALVVGQIAVSMLLLVGAGLFVRSLGAARDVDPGFDTGPAAIVHMSPEMIGYDDDRERLFFDRLTQQVLAAPGIDAVALADRLPVGPQIQTWGFTFSGIEPPAGRETWSIDVASVDAAYFDVMGVPIVAGRVFSPVEGPSTARVAVVSAAFAERFFPAGDALGNVFYRGSDTSEPVRILGIARDAKVRTLGEAPRPYVYMNVHQSGIGSLQLVARGTLPATRIADEVRRIAREIEPRLPILEARTMEQHLALMLFPPRMAALLLSVFGGLGLLLAAIGIWGIVSYSVARRTREVGVRMALGASPGEAVRLLTSSGARLVLIGAAAGIALALVASRLIARFLFGVGAFDPLTFAGVPLLLAAVGVLAAWIPARRAARVDPMHALRVN